MTTAPILYLEEQIRFQKDILFHLMAGGEPDLSPTHRDNIIAQLRKERKQTEDAIRLLKTHELAVRSAPGRVAA